MIEKLKNISVRYNEINEKLADAGIISDIAQYKALM